MKTFAALAVAMLVVACGPKMDGLEKGEKAKVTQVRDGDTFEMEGGLVVHLAGVEAPGGDQPRAKEARAALEKLVAHRAVQLAYGGQKRARDAAVAQVFARTEGGRWVWVQQSMLLSGDARVHTRRENVARLDEMRTAEAAARSAKRGMWSDAFYAVRTASAVARSEEDTAADPACIAERAALASARAERKAAAKDSDTAADRAPSGAQTIAATGSDASPQKAGEPEGARSGQRPRRARDFHIVEGQITSVADRERAVFLNFGDDITRDFGVMVPKDALETWPGGLEALAALQGQTVRVRGDIARCGKPLMRVDHVQQVETVGGE